MRATNPAAKLPEFRGIAWLSPPGQRAQMKCGREEYRPVSLISQIPSQPLAAIEMVQGIPEQISCASVTCCEQERRPFLDQMALTPKDLRPWQGQHSTEDNPASEQDGHDAEY